MAADDTPHQVLLLLLELLQSGELPELAVGGAWKVGNDVMNRGSTPLGPVALEADICGLATAHLRAIGPAADWVVRTVERRALPVAVCTLCQRAARKCRS